MEYNAELEKAEAQLRDNLREERHAREERRRLLWTWTDNAIGVAAILHFVAAAGWAAAFAVLTLLRISGREVSGWVWACSLPVAIAFLGVGLALVRVLDLTTRPSDRGQPGARQPDRSVKRANAETDMAGDAPPGFA